MKTTIRIALAMLIGTTTWLAQAADYPSGYSKCANEGGTCTVKNAPNTVAYGIKDKWVYKYVTSSTVACTTATFGSDQHPDTDQSRHNNAHANQGGDRDADRHTNRHRNPHADQSGYTHTDGGCLQLHQYHFCRQEPHPDRRADGRFHRDVRAL